MKAPSWFREWAKQIYGTEDVEVLPGKSGPTSIQIPVPVSGASPDASPGYVEFMLGHHAEEVYLEGRRLTGTMETTEAGTLKRGVTAAEEVRQVVGELGKRLTPSMGAEEASRIVRETLVGGRETPGLISARPAFERQTTVARAVTGSYTRPITSEERIDLARYEYLTRGGQMLFPKETHRTAAGGLEELPLRAMPAEALAAIPGIFQGSGGEMPTGGDVGKVAKHLFKLATQHPVSLEGMTPWTSTVRAEGPPGLPEPAPLEQGYKIRAAVAFGGTSLGAGAGATATPLTPVQTREQRIAMSREDLERIELAQGPVYAPRHGEAQYATMGGKPLALDTEQWAETIISNARKQIAAGADVGEVVMDVVRRGGETNIKSGPFKAFMMEVAGREGLERMFGSGIAGLGVEQVFDPGSVKNLRQLGVSMLQAVPMADVRNLAVQGIQYVQSRPQEEQAALLAEMGLRQLPQVERIGAVLGGEDVTWTAETDPYLSIAAMEKMRQGLSMQWVPIDLQRELKGAFSQEVLQSELAQKGGPLYGLAQILAPGSEAPPAPGPQGGPSPFQGATRYWAYQPVLSGEFFVQLSRGWGGGQVRLNLRELEMLRSQQPEFARSLWQQGAGFRERYWAPIRAHGATTGELEDVESYDWKALQEKGFFRAVQQHLPEREAGARIHPAEWSEAWAEAWKELKLSPTAQVQTFAQVGGRPLYMANPVQQQRLMAMNLAGEPVGALPTRGGVLVEEMMQAQMRGAAVGLGPGDYGQVGGEKLRAAAEAYAEELELFAQSPTTMQEITSTRPQGFYGAYQTASFVEPGHAFVSPEVIRSMVPGADTPEKIAEVEQMLREEYARGTPISALPVRRPSGEPQQFRAPVALLPESEAQSRYGVGKLGHSILTDMNSIFAQWGDVDFDTGIWVLGQSIKFEGGEGKPYIDKDYAQRLHDSLVRDQRQSALYREGESLAATAVKESLQARGPREVEAARQISEEFAAFAAVPGAQPRDWLESFGKKGAGSEVVMQNLRRAFGARASAEEIAGASAFPAAAKGYMGVTDVYRAAEAQMILGRYGDTPTTRHALSGATAAYQEMLDARKPLPQQWLEQAAFMKSWNLMSYVNEEGEWTRGGGWSFENEPRYSEPIKAAKEVTKRYASEEMRRIAPAEYQATLFARSEEEIPQIVKELQEAEALGGERGEQAWQRVLGKYFTEEEILGTGQGPRSVVGEMLWRSGMTKTQERAETIEAAAPGLLPVGREEELAQSSVLGRMQRSMNTLYKWSGGALSFLREPLAAAARATGGPIADVADWIQTEAMRGVRPVSRMRETAAAAAAPPPPPPPPTDVAAPPPLPDEPERFSLESATPPSGIPEEPADYGELGELAWAQLEREQRQQARRPQPAAQSGLTMEQVVQRQYTGGKAILQPVGAGWGIFPLKGDELKEERQQALRAAPSGAWAHAEGSPTERMSALRQELESAAATPIAPGAGLKGKELEEWAGSLRENRQAIDLLTKQLGVAEKEHGVYAESLRQTYRALGKQEQAIKQQIQEAPTAEEIATLEKRLGEVRGMREGAAGELGEAQVERKRIALARARAGEWREEAGASFEEAGLTAAGKAPRGQPAYYALMSAMFLPHIQQAMEQWQWGAPEQAQQAMAVQQAAVQAAYIGGSPVDVTGGLVGARRRREAQWGYADYLQGLGAEEVYSLGGWLPGFLSEHPGLTQAWGAGKALVGPWIGAGIQTEMLAQGALGRGLITGGQKGPALLGQAPALLGLAGIGTLAGYTGSKWLYEELGKQAASTASPEASQMAQAAVATDQGWAQRAVNFFGLEDVSVGVQSWAIERGIRYGQERKGLSREEAIEEARQLRLGAMSPEQRRQFEVYEKMSPTAQAQETFGAGFQKFLQLAANAGIPTEEAVAYAQISARQGRQIPQTQQELERFVLAMRPERQAELGLGMKAGALRTQFQQWGRQAGLLYTQPEFGQFVDMGVAGLTTLPSAMQTQALESIGGVMPLVEAARTQWAMQPVQAQAFGATAFAQAMGGVTPERMRLGVSAVAPLEQIGFTPTQMAPLSLGLAASGLTQFQMGELMKEAVPSTGFAWSRAMAGQGLPQLAYLDTATGLMRGEAQEMGLSRFQDTWKAASQLGGAVTIPGGQTIDFGQGRLTEDIRTMENTWNRQQETWKIQDEQLKRRQWQEDRSLELDRMRLDLAMKRAGVEMDGGSKELERSERRLEIETELFDMKTGWQREDFNIAAGRAQAQRQWQTEDFTVARNKFELTQGWQQEDFERNIRYATGRQRVELERQRERAIQVANLERAQMTKQEERAETTFQWQEEDRERAQERFEAQVVLQRELMALQKSAADEAKRFHQEELAILAKQNEILLKREDDRDTEKKEEETLQKIQRDGWTEQHAAQIERAKQDKAYYDYVIPQANALAEISRQNREAQAVHQKFLQDTWAQFKKDVPDAARAMADNANSLLGQYNQILDVLQKVEQVINGLKNQKGGAGGDLVAVVTQALMEKIMREFQRP